MTTFVRARAWQSGVGLKLLMAVSAIVLIGYVVIHVLGTLLVFLGPAWINGWGAFLHSTGPLLWAVRLVLLCALVVHVAAAVILAVRARRARPVPYARLTRQASPVASRTMAVTGGALLLFALYHVPQFTAGIWHPRFVTGDAYGNIVSLFFRTLEYPIYAAALVALGLHLYHGAWSLLRTLGVPLPVDGVRRHGLTTALVLLVIAGFAAILAAVAVGGLRLTR